MKFTTFLNLFQDITSNYNKIKKEEYQPFGLYPIIDQGQNFIGGYTNDKSLINHENYPVIVFGDHTKVFKYVDFPFAIGADGVKVLSLKDRSNYTKCYYFYFKGLTLTDAGYSRHFKFLKESKLPVFENRNEQIQIANLLSKVESIIDQRKEGLGLLDDFLESTFYEMFGDPVSNEKGWKISFLNDLCNKITDGTHDTPERLRSGVKYITGKHIAPFTIDFENSDYVSEEVLKEIYKRTNVEFEDVLYTNIGANVGTAARVKVNYEFSLKNVALLKHNRSKLKSHYLEHLLNFQTFKDKLLYQLSVGGAQKFLNLKSIGQIKIPVAPIELQNEFASIVEKVEVLKKDFTESLHQLDNLFGSLRQRAFNGDFPLLKVSQGIVGASDEGKDSLRDELNLTKIETEQWHNNKERPVAKIELPTVEAYEVRFPLEVILPNLLRKFDDEFFTFNDVREEIVKNNYKYEFETVKTFLFKLLRKGELTQVFADAAFKATFDEADPAYKKIMDLNEQIYLQRTSVF